MAQYSEAFGQWVSDNLRRRKVSPYEVERLSNGKISHQTVRNMAKGKIPYLDYVLELAETIELDAQETNKGLLLTGRRIQVPVSVRFGVGTDRALAISALG